MSIDSIVNLQKNDDLNGFDEDNGQPLIHLRVQQRNAKKRITTIQGLSEDLNLKQIVKYMKKTYSCNGAIINHVDYGKIIQLSGDQRGLVKKSLIEQEIVTEAQIKIHGI